MRKLCPRAPTVAGVFDCVGGDVAATVVARCMPTQLRQTVTSVSGQAGWLTWGCLRDHGRRRDRVGSGTDAVDCGDSENVTRAVRETGHCQRCGGGVRMRKLCPRAPTVAGVLNCVGGDASTTVVARRKPTQSCVAITRVSGQAGWLSWGCLRDYRR